MNKQVMGWVKKWAKQDEDAMVLAFIPSKRKGYYIIRTEIHKSVFGSSRTDISTQEAGAELLNRIKSTLITQGDE